MDYFYSTKNDLPNGINHKQLQNEINASMAISANLLYILSHNDTDQTILHFDDKISPDEKKNLDIIINVHNPLPLLSNKIGDLQIFNGLGLEYISVGPDGSQLTADSKVPCGVKWF